MSFKAQGLLTVDPNAIHKVDTNNTESLRKLWALFANCAESVEQGRRLEYFSWRLWQRETFCCETDQTKTHPKLTVALPEIPERPQLPDVPQLSGSVESAVDEEAFESTAETDPLNIMRPRIVRQDSCDSSRSRGRERHITSDHLEKMVTTIVQDKDLNLSPLPQISSPSIEPASIHSQTSCSDIEQPPKSQAMQAARSRSTASGSWIQPQMAKSDPSEPSPATNVIRGFSLSPIPSLRVSGEPKVPKPDAIPEPDSAPAHKPVPSKRQPPKFSLGGESSSNESSPQSLEARKAVPAPKKNKMFEVGVSSASAEDEQPSLKSALHSGRPSSLLSAQKKQTSFSNQITTRTIPTPSDHSDSYVDESAIDNDESAIDDDDEDSEWEDSIEESGKSSVDDPVTFKRVPSKANLTSQRSLISLMFAGQEDRAKNLSNYASHSTSAIPQRARQLHTAPHGLASSNDSDDSGLEMRRERRPTHLRPINEIPRSGAQPITTNGQAYRQQQAALSPRTTRRNMLATELTESLRRQLLWERQQKSSTAMAVLKRRHTSTDVANLKQYPEKAYMSNKTKDEANSSSWNQYLREDGYGGYHAQGW
ncbi:hypothetical protein GGR56DRAFT_423884 [Xylariaceae sp. FL0804]|nr:hypothetical protein GGR56DRAFT_423884 [Xylariaceae sp. FL0804]